MGKASSAKKVARAAGLGGNRAYATRPAYGFYLSVVILIVLGLVGVYNAREYETVRVNHAGNFKPHVGRKPPWREAFAIDECGKLLPDIKSDKDPYGISTKGDGIIYVSPTQKSAAGHNATLGKFASSIGMKFNAGEIQVPGGKLYSDGASCEGKDGHVYVEVWQSPAEPQSDGTVETTKSAEDLCNPDCDSGVLLEDDQLVTIAFLPPGKDNKPPTNIPQPSKKTIATLDKLEAPAVTTTTAAPTTSSTPVASSTTATTPGTKKTTTTSATTTTTTGTTTSAVTTTTAARTTTTATVKKAKNGAST